MMKLNDLQQRIFALLPQVEMRFFEPMAKHTSFRIGGPAEVMVFPKNASELSEILKCGLPCEEDYGKYFKNPLSVQHPLASIEIVPFDSAYVMLLSKDKKIVDDFMRVYTKSEWLEEYNK